LKAVFNCMIPCSAACNLIAIFPSNDVDIHRCTLLQLVSTRQIYPLPDTNMAGLRRSAALGPAAVALFYDTADCV
jgi:hypothetical protein